MDVSAVFINMALISDGVREGYSCTSKAADPAIMGEAPDVPEKASSPVPVPAIADTDAPGAPMSGLIELRLWLGPLDDEPTILMASGRLMAGE
jgi:hypothetical protein